MLKNQITFYQEHNFEKKKLYQIKHSMVEKDFLFYFKY